MSHKKIIMLFALLLLLFTGCEDTIGSGSSSADGSTNDNGNPLPSEYQCTIDRIYVSSLNCSGWDPFGGNGEPRFKIYFNGSLIKSTNYIQDASSYDFPATFYVDKTILRPFDGKLKVVLIDVDTNNDDTKISITVDLNNYKNQSYIEFDYTGYNLKSKIYLNWSTK